MNAEPEDQGPHADRDPDQDEIDAEFDAAVARMNARGGVVADTPMWLSHHWPDQYDRCASVGGLHVCRRCLVLYPIAIGSALLLSQGDWWSHDMDALVLWLFPLPGVIEFVLDNLALIRYRPVRQMVLSAFGAFAAGLGYTRYLDDTYDELTWTVVAVYTGVCLAAGIAAGLGYGRGGKRDRSGRVSSGGGDDGTGHGESGEAAP